MSDFSMTFLVMLCVIIHLTICDWLKTRYIDKFKWFLIVEYITLIALIIYEYFSDSYIAQDLFENFTMFLLLLIVHSVILYFNIKKLKPIYIEMQKSSYKVVMIGRWSSLTADEVDYIGSCIRLIDGEFTKKNSLYLTVEKKRFRFTLVFFSRNDYGLFKKLRGDSESYINEKVTMNNDRVSVVWDVARNIG